jgi:hypothetical protein
MLVVVNPTLGEPVPVIVDVVDRTLELPGPLGLVAAVGPLQNRLTALPDPIHDFQ